MLGGHALAHEELQPLLVDINTLRPHAENPKNGDIDAIVESLTVNGMYRPLYVTDDGVILAGNHTYHALLELGATQAPVIRLHVDGTQARQIMLADNRIADLGRYDDALLLDLLEQLDADGALHGTGYTDDDMELLRLAQLDPPPAIEGYTQTGDLIIHGLPLDAIADFHDHPGEDDRDRFLRLLGYRHDPDDPDDPDDTDEENPQE